MKPLVIGTGRPAQRLQRHGRGHLCRLEEPIQMMHLQASDREHRLRSIQQGDAFLGLQLQRPQPCLSQACSSRNSLTSDEGLPFADQHQRHMRQGGKVSACPDAPTHRHDGGDAMIEQIA